MSHESRSSGLRLSRRPLHHLLLFICLTFSLCSADVSAEVSSFLLTFLEAGCLGVACVCKAGEAEEDRCMQVPDPLAAAEAGRLERGP